MVIEGRKTCSKCRLNKPVSAFTKSESESDGYKYRCKNCNNASSKEYYRSDLERNRKRGYEKSVKRRYGIAAGEYQRMQREQNGRCAACLSLPVNGKALVVDHDHKTGRVRSLLCHHCNVALGSLRDDPERCYKLAEYAAVHGPGFALEVK